MGLELGVIATAGLLIGSFLNVVIHRLPRDRSVAEGRSRCPRCGALIHWWDNIPIVSWIALRARCRKCHAKISWRYPAVEAACALLFAATYWRASSDPMGAGISDPGFWVRDLPFVAILLAAAVIDLEHRIIPDELSLGGMALGIATAWLPSSVGMVQSVAGCAIGFGAFYLLAWSYERAKGVSGLGGGDVKLLGMLGAFLGPLGVFAVILISSLVGSVGGLIWAARRRGRGSLLKTAIPFGPFLVLAAYYTFFIGERFWLPFTKPM